MTDDELAAIEYRECGVDSTEDVGVIMASAKDVPALVAEVRRLRAAVLDEAKWTAAMRAKLAEECERSMRARAELAAERVRCAAHCDNVARVYGAGNPVAMFSDEVPDIVAQLAADILSGRPAPSPPDAPRT